MHSSQTPCPPPDTHSYRQHGMVVRVELCVDWLLLAELRQNVNVGPLYVVLCCTVDGCYDVSAKRTANETLQKSHTASRNIPTDGKLNNKTPNLTNSKCPQISLQLPNIRKCHIMNGQTAMLNGATDFYSFGTKLHNVSFVLNYAT